MPKENIFFEKVSSQKKSKLLNLPDELMVYILSFMGKSDIRALINFSITSKKSYPLGQERLHELIYKITLESTPAPILESLRKKLGESENNMGKAIFNMLRKDKETFVQVKKTLDTATKLHHEVLRLEEKNANPGWFMNCNADVLKALIFMGVFVGGLLMIVFLPMAIEEKSWQIIVYGGSMIAVAFLAAFLCVISKNRRAELISSLSYTKKNLAAQIDFGFLSKSKDKMTRNLPQLDIQHNGDDLEIGRPNRNADVSERSPLLIHKPG